MELHIDINSKSVDEIVSALNKQFDVFIGELQKELVKLFQFVAERVIIPHIPVKTGALRESIVVESTSSQDEIVIGCYAGKNRPVPYAVFIEEGTKPHDIYPKNKKVLRFEVKGNVVFAKKVHHPGTGPYMMFFKGYVSVKHLLPQYIDRAIERTLL